jgi:NADH:ubiquinone oxidoreductase subunit 2 (subunit N)
MGAGFMLLETQIVSRLALYFGTVWQVNGIVITALLLALLLANVAVERMKRVPKLFIWAGLVVALMAAYWFPFDRIEGSPEIIGILAVAVFSIPVMFAGILFSAEFREATSPSAALNANVMGAVLGGLLENLSLLFGLRALLLIAFALYCVAGAALVHKRPAVVSR